MLWPLLVQRGSACRICFVPRGPRNCFCSWPPCPLPLQNQLHQGRDRKVKCMARWQNQIWFQNCSNIFYWWLPHWMIWMAKGSTWSCSQHGLHHLTAGCLVSHGVASLRPLIPPEHCSGNTRSMDLGSLAVRQQANPQLAAIALAASQRWGTGLGHPDPQWSTTNIYIIIHLLTANYILVSSSIQPLSNHPAFWILLGFLVAPPSINCSLSGWQISGRGDEWW